MPTPADPLDLTALSIFCAVAQEGSVTRAAERLQRVQSNVTTRVRQLEADVGAELFSRQGKRMVLSPAGQVLLGYAQRLLALAEEARQAVRPGQPTGRLRLGAMESTAASRLPMPLARLHQQWPEVALELVTGPTQTLVDQLRAHALDAALVAWPPGAPMDAELQAQPVWTEELLLVLPAGHPPVRGPQDVLVGTLAVFEHGCTYRRMVQDWLAPRAQPLRVLELGSYHAIVACVAGGGCVGVAPRSLLALAQQGVQDGPALVLHPLAAIATQLVWRRGYQSAALAALQHELLTAPPKFCKSSKKV